MSLMFKLKLLFVLTILPISYFIYHLIGFDSGINAYFEKIKTLKEKEAIQAELAKEILLYKEKISFFDAENINLDYLEEKSFDTLGLTNRNSFTIIIK